MKNRFMSFFSGNEKEEWEKGEQDRDFIGLIHEAREEWQTALNYFENVSDPELVDFAIYRVEAARRKYMYLLKQARKKGLADRFVPPKVNKVNLS
jgi:hypothetical protein